MRARIRAAGAALTITGASIAGMAAVVPSAGAATTPSSQDVTWAQSNAQTDLAEITIGNIAMQRAQLASTKALATKTVSDHQTALSKLKALAGGDGITLPTTPNATQQAQAATLQSVPESSFDASYDSAQVQGHELSISQTQTEISSGSDSGVIAFAQYYLPVAQMHLQMAQAAYASATGGAAPSAVEAGTGGMAATRADLAPWLFVGAAGAAVLVATGGVALRRRRASA